MIKHYNNTNSNHSIILFQNNKFIILDLLYINILFVILLCIVSIVNYIFNIECTNTNKSILYLCIVWNNIQILYQILLCILILQILIHLYTFKCIVWVYIIKKYKTTIILEYNINPLM